MHIKCVFGHTKCVVCVVSMSSPLSHEIIRGVTNDLTYLVNNASLSMYANDHQLYFKGHTVKSVEKQLNEGGHTMLQGYKDNFLKGNYEK